MKTKETPTQVIKVKDIEVVSNTRTDFEEPKTIELAESIKVHGLLQPIGVLKREGEKYRLIFGERRFRASHLNNDKEITCKVFENLNEDQILEIQIIENLQREDVHPMDEARAFSELTKAKTHLKEIAAKVAKSLSYVSQRIKLNDLVEQFQTAFKANRLSVSNALEVAVLPQDSQTMLWEDKCAHIKGNKPFIIQSHTLNQYKANLKNATFNTKDKTLIPEAGACTGCQFNTACQKLLFGSEAKSGTCTNAPCFKAKTTKAFENAINQALEEPGTELINTAYGDPSSETLELIEKGYAVLGRNSIEVLSMPDKPEFEDYDYGDEEENKEEFDRDLKSYEEEVVAFKALQESGKVKRGFVVEGNKKGQFVEFILSEAKPMSGNGAVKVTAKALQEKIKNDTVTAEDYQAEIERLKSSEERKKELDEEKTTPLFYEALEANTVFPKKADAFEKVELCTMIMLMKEFGGFWRSEELLEGMFNDDIDDLEQFNVLMALSMEDLNNMYFRLCRCVMLLKLKPHNGARPSYHYKAQALLSIGNLYINDQITAIWDEQMVIRNKREAQLAVKIQSLEAKKLDVKPIEKAA